MNANTDKQTCYCCSNQPFESCCEPYLTGKEKPKTPEALMRSRYSAFVLKDIPYIDATMKGKAKQKADLDQTALWLENVAWLNLSVKQSKTPTPTTGTVHFVARFQENGEEQQIEEVSQFKKIAGSWYYIQGKQANLTSKQGSAEKIGRNEPCSCGSGKKFKHCCG